MISQNIVKLQYFKRLEKKLQFLSDFQLLVEKKAQLIQQEIQEALLLNFIPNKEIGI